jgi:hypothetical protein
MTYLLRATLLVALTGTAIAAASGPALGSRSPSKSEIKGITAAVSVFHLDCQGCTWKVAHVRVSTVDPHFAVADEVGRRNGQPLQGARALVWHGVSKWAVITDGSDVGIGCGYVKAVVRADLFGTSACP